jgi:hypothetical protein
MGIYGNYISESFDYLDVIQEAYFGKTETLLEIEKQIGLIRQNAAKRYTDINRSKEVLELNRLFEKQFGMEVFSLHVEQNNIINAYTALVATRFDIAFKEILAKKVTATKKDGYRFLPGNNLCIVCTVYLGLLNCQDLTDGEIVAIILHELGHNFADAIYKDIEIANKKQVKDYLDMLILTTILTCGLYLPGALKEYYNNLNKTVKKRESKTRKRPIHGLIKGIKAKCSDFFDVYNEVIERLGMGRDINKYKKDADSKGYPKKVKKSASRYNEVIADKFAGIYGYGPEQGSALLKMDSQISKAEDIVNSIPGIGIKANKAYNDAIKDIYNYDCHPHVIQRINEEIKTLRYELQKSDLDPKLVKAMNEQLDQLEALKNEATKIVDSSRDNERARATFYKYVNDKDPNAIDDAIEEAINIAFDNVIED